MQSEENKQATTGRLTYDTDIRIRRDGIGVTTIDYVKDSYGKIDSMQEEMDNVSREKKYVKK